MSWYKIELTKEQLIQKEDMIVEQKIETIKSALKDRNHKSYFKNLN